MAVATAPAADPVADDPAAHPGRLPWARFKGSPAAIAVVVITAVSLAVHVVWILRFRDGQPVDIDEAGYLGFSLDNFFALGQDGLRELVRTVLRQEVQAPLAPFLAVPVHLVLGPTVLGPLAVPLLAFAVVVPATALIAQRAGGTRAAVLAAALVATAPVVVDYARSFHFALPATACFAAAVACFLRARGGESYGWSAAWGACLGLTLLARTVTVAFAPALPAMAAFAVLAGPNRKRRAVGLGIALACGVLVAATWYARNADAVLDYLRSFGYGERSVEHGPERSITSLSTWTEQARTYVSGYLYVPLSALFVVGWAAAAVAAWRSLTRTWRTRGPAVVAQRVAVAPTALFAVVLVEGWLALLSSRAIGSAFVAPLVPVAVALAVAGLVGLTRGRSLTPVVVAVVLVATVTFVSKAGLVEALSDRRTLDLPVAGDLVVVDGGGKLQRYLEAGGYQTGSPADRPPREVGEAWGPVTEDVALTLDGYAEARGETAVSVFGFRHLILNVNSVGLASRLLLRRGLDVVQVEPVLGDTAEDYAEVLDPPDAATPNLLLTASPGPGEFDPPVTTAEVEEAGREAGFRRVRSWDLPDGRVLRMWWRGDA